MLMKNRIEKNIYDVLKHTKIENEKFVIGKSVINSINKQNLTNKRKITTLSSKTIESVKNIKRLPSVNTFKKKTTK
jgi:hypothetical protein